MGLFSFVTVGVIAYLSVKRTSAVCEGGATDNVEAIYGQHTSLTCKGTSACNMIEWQNGTNGRVPREDTGHTRIIKENTTSVLHILRSTLEDVGTFRCWCYDSYGNTVEKLPICSFTVEMVCQAVVLVNDTTFIYNNTHVSNYVNINEGVRIKTKCPEDAEPATNCRRVQLRASAKYDFNIKVSPVHNSCYIECGITGNDENNCTVRVTLSLITVEAYPQPLATSTTALNKSSQSPRVTFTSKQSSKLPYEHPASENILTTESAAYEDGKGNTCQDQSSRFQVLIVPVCVLTILLVGNLCFACFFIYNSRCKANHPSTEAEIVINTPQDITIPFTAKGNGYSTQLYIKRTDDVYAEVNNAEKEELSIELTEVNTGTSITEDYYTVGNNSSTTKLGSMDIPIETDREMMYANALP